jgi:hypothetical protein
MKNFEKIIQRFEEKDPVFHSISRQKIDEMNMSLKDTPPPGLYYPKQYDSFIIKGSRGKSLS